MSEVAMAEKRRRRPSLGMAEVVRTGRPMDEAAESRWAQRALAAVRPRARGAPLPPHLRVAVNFHPDHMVGGRTVLESLAASGTYRSQFETGISNGGLTARRGGDRFEWERRSFDGVYDDAPPQHRPKYGALNHRERDVGAAPRFGSAYLPPGAGMRARTAAPLPHLKYGALNHRERDVGAAPRFGSAYLRLAAHTLARTTFCFPDSVNNPERFGTANACDLIAAAEDFARSVRTEAQEARTGGMLDDYVEAHVHGPVVLAADVEAVVLDPCYRGTRLAEQAAALEVPVEWHEGRVLTVDELVRHPDFRGRRIMELGRRLVVHERLDASIIGAARAAGAAHVQDLKLLWHLVARFGTPRVH